MVENAVFDYASLKFSCFDAERGWHLKISCGIAVHGNTLFYIVLFFKTHLECQIAGET